MNIIIEHKLYRCQKEIPNLKKKTAILISNMQRFSKQYYSLNDDK